MARTFHDHDVPYFRHDPGCRYVSGGASFCRKLPPREPLFADAVDLYLASSSLLAFAGLLAVIGGLIFLFDTIELMRRSVGVDTHGLRHAAWPCRCLKLPHTAQTTLPFVVMMAMMYCQLFRLSRSQETGGDTLGRGFGVAVSGATVVAGERDRFVQSHDVRSLWAANAL